ncbi:hypothetical protein EUGRSUZ_C00697 [Eucalyptus grandis]|uniref:PGG domain-containing protein n=2 Tax=Eucalyptus grandis TaxID=71139 RepID=A0A059CLL9_EUCGR|nr:hypothetical protein EUGRSUZ_C00697 [Eucalyptus grandis]
MEFELYEAAMKGNVHSLLELLKKDKLLLDRIMTGNRNETPLHIAAMLGHLDFVEEILAQKTELAREQDSQSSTPLHLAAAKGYLHIVESLVRVDPEICLFRDKYKRNPLHVAAMKGHVDVLECLVQARHDAAHSVVEHGQTILHLCVKHNKLEALKLLIDILGDDQFINSRDEDGNTILHLAAADGQTETITFLTNKGVDPNITNSKGFTALGLLAQGQSMERALEIVNYVPQTSENHDPSKRTVVPNNTVTTFHTLTKKEIKRERKRKWQKGMHEALMVVAILVATIAYEAGKDPPNESAKAMRGFENCYKLFKAFNTISFIASLSTIILLISGLPLKRRRITTWIVMLTMWVAITCTALSYSFLIVFASPEKDKTYDEDPVVVIAVRTWTGLMSLIFLCHIIRLIWKLVLKVLRLVCRVLRLVGKVLKFVYKAFKKGKSENPMV